MTYKSLKIYFQAYSIIKLFLSREFTYAYYDVIPEAPNAEEYEHPS
jgi:hypothetical protein